jgi:hypothetical protein
MNINPTSSNNTSHSQTESKTPEPSPVDSLTSQVAQMALSISKPKSVIKFSDSELARIQLFRDGLRKNPNFSPAISKETLPLFEIAQKAAASEKSIQAQKDAAAEYAKLKAEQELELAMNPVARREHAKKLSLCTVNLLIQAYHRENKGVRLQMCLDSKGWPILDPLNKSFQTINLSTKETVWLKHQ